jgi:hypothetical protein
MLLWALDFPYREDDRGAAAYPGWRRACNVAYPGLRCEALSGLVILGVLFSSEHLADPDGNLFAASEMLEKRKPQSALNQALIIGKDFWGLLYQNRTNDAWIINLDSAVY